MFIEEVANTHKFVEIIRDEVTQYLHTPCPKEE